MPVDSARISELILEIVKDYQPISSSRMHDRVVYFFTTSASEIPQFIDDIREVAWKLQVENKLFFSNDRKWYIKERTL